MSETNSSLKALIENKIASDSEFQASLENMTDEEKDQAISQKREELIESEWKSTAEAKSKFEADYGNQKKRAEIAESKLKEKPGDVQTNPSDIPSGDLYALIEAKVPREDIDDVREYALLKKISISEALNQPLLKAFLNDKSEKRKTAQVTSTRSTRATSKKDGAAIMQAAREQGESGLPDFGSSDAEELFWARRGGRRK